VEEIRTIRLVDSHISYIDTNELQREEAWIMAYNLVQKEK
jgi:hypothetical protein